ncbi:MAG: hypothetical protein ABII26_05655 [Pseudomonadota bacterium]
MNEIQISTVSWLFIVGISVGVGILFGYMLGLWENHIVKKAIEMGKEDGTDPH